MSAVNKLMVKIRLKLNDLELKIYSPYEVMEAINDAKQDLLTTAEKYYASYSFKYSKHDIETGDDDSGWPDIFDNTIVDYAVIVLSQGDYLAKEQAKEYWRKKAIGLLARYSTETGIEIRDYHDFPYGNDGGQ